MHVLHLSTGIALLTGEVQADQRERSTYRACVLSNVLGAIGINRQLMNELRVPPCQRIGGHFVVKLPTGSRRIVALFGWCLRHRQADATTWTVLIKGCDHTESLLLRRHCGEVSL